MGGKPNNAKPLYPGDDGYEEAPFQMTYIFHPSARIIPAKT